MGVDVRGSGIRVIWLQTRSGAAYDLFAPDVNMITLGDTAHALSLICRYTGHTRVFYSVAQHSVLCARVARDRGHDLGVQRAALMHDAHESVTGDVASPIKRAIGASWSDFERRHEIAFRTRFGVPRDLPRDVKAIDLAMLETERRALMEPSPRPIGDGWPDANPADVAIYPWPSAVAAFEFVVEAARLEIR